MTVETITLKGMYFQPVDNQALSTQGQPDVNLHRLTARDAASSSSTLARSPARSSAAALEMTRRLSSEQWRSKLRKKNTKGVQVESTVCNIRIRIESG